MAIEKLTRAQYEAWAQDFFNLKLAEPSDQDVEAAEKVKMIEVQSTHQGCMMRVISATGGGIDLHLNAAHAIHLYRYLALAGQIGGWMNKNGEPITEPPVVDELQRLPPIDQL